MIEKETRDAVRQKCKFCSKLMAPAGGIVGTGTLYWKCWSCDYSLVFSHDALVGTEEVENDN